MSEPEKNSYERLQERLREVPIADRLRGAITMISQMCSKGRPPRMTIPVQWDDEDFWISNTLRDARERIAELETRIEAADRFLANATLVTENDRLREELRKALARNVNTAHITERLQWVIQACEIDRDARAELEALISESEAK